MLRGLRQLHPKVVRKTTWILRAPRSRQANKDALDLLDNYKAINAALAEACGFALKQQITGRQYVRMTDTSFRA